MALLPVLKEHKVYVSEDLMQKRKVTLKYLDIKTGDVDHVAGTARLVPMPAATLQQIPGGGLNKHLEGQNLDLYLRDAARAREEKNDPDTRFCEALAVQRITDAYDTLWNISSRANWRGFFHDTTFLRSLTANGDICSEIKRVFEPIEEDGDLDEERPCVVGYQVDRNPLIEGRLLTSELNALIVLAIEYDKDPAYADRNEFVITSSPDAIGRYALPRAE